MKLIIGNISYLTKEDGIEEYTDKERLAIVHSIHVTVECADEDEAGELGFISGGYRLATYLKMRAEIGLN